MSDCEFIKELLIVAAEHGIMEELFWTEELNFSILCNDFFFWGASDGEPVTADTLPELKKALEEVNDSVDGPLLYCARMRGMRPQNAYYKYLMKENWELFNRCGPERETSICNPGKMEV
jgi:hypothetical protein